MSPVYIHNTHARISVLGRQISAVKMIEGVDLERSKKL